VGSTEWAVLVIAVTALLCYTPSSLLSAPCVPPFSALIKIGSTHSLTSAYSVLPSVTLHTPITCGSSEVSRFFGAPSTSRSARGTSKRLAIQRARGATRRTTAQPGYQEEPLRRPRAHEIFAREQRCLCIGIFRSGYRMGPAGIFFKTHHLTSYSNTELFGSSAFDWY
jgi:hypothetical protein